MRILHNYKYIVILLVGLLVIVGVVIRSGEKAGTPLEREVLRLNVLIGRNPDLKQIDKVLGQPDAVFNHGNELEKYYTHPSNLVDVAVFVSNNKIIRILYVKKE